MQTKEKQSAPSTHTPGPWQYLYGNPWNDDEGNRLIITAVDKTRTICQALNNGDIDNTEANARLIAATPELLKFVQAYVDDAACGDGGQHETDKTNGECWHCTAVALVTKATGGAK